MNTTIRFRIGTADSASSQSGKGKEKVKFLNGIRHARRRPVRSTARRVTRAALRVRWCAPDDLGHALVAFRRALCAHRRLARLAPSFFDSVIVERERRERAQQRRWMAEWEPVLARVYGSEPQPPLPEDEFPSLPPPRIQRAAERELAAHVCWMTAGREAIERFRQRHPHALISFTRLPRLLEVAANLSRLACGCDPSRPDPQPTRFDVAWADLERAYGPDSAAASAEAAPPQEPAAKQPHPAAGSGPGQSPPPAVPEPHPLPAPAPAACRRRDAWSSWAGCLRRMRAINR